MAEEKRFIEKVQDLWFEETQRGWVNAQRVERERIIALIEPHLSVCNYRAVTEEDCDVCHWVKDTLVAIRKGWAS